MPHYSSNLDFSQTCLSLPVTEITPLAMIGFLEVCEKSRLRKLLEHFHFYPEQDTAAKCGFS